MKKTLNYASALASPSSQARFPVALLRGKRAPLNIQLIDDSSQLAARRVNFRAFVAVILSISMLFTAVSCDKEPVADRPDLPPIESLVMDFSDFSQLPGEKKGTELSYENFGHAFWSVFLFSTVTTITLAVPVAAYGYALQQDAVYLGDYTWEWSFTFPVGSADYTATLTGERISNEEFTMEMVISLTAFPDQGQKWFDGIIRYDHTHATWNLYKEDGVKVVEAEWNKDFETEEADLTYTYTESGHEQEGSYIKLAYFPEEFYDAAYTISLAAGMTNIEWNTTTTEGRVMAPVKFGDEEWHCWASQAEGFMDKVCD